MSATDADVVVLGAGAAGMMAAAVAGQRGLRVLLLDHAHKLAEKIRISGGGRCNFTNLEATGSRGFLSANPAFCRSALARYTPQDFLALLRRHGVAWHEKHRGQLFCDTSSEAIIDVLRRECDAGGVQWRLGCAVHEVRHRESPAGGCFEIATDAGLMRAPQLVVATGGLALPQVGATDLALKLARQFGLKVVEPRPALVPLTFSDDAWQRFRSLAGASLEVDIATGNGRRGGQFREDLLLTHRGLSGPAVLQISSYWEPGQALRVNLVPGEPQLADTLLASKSGNRQQLVQHLAQWLPRRLVEPWLLQAGLEAHGSRRLADLPDRVLREVGTELQHWQIVPSGTAGYRKAEVMRGGVDTRQLDQQSGQARGVPGLYFVGEAVDVTGWLGGYNFQWAWASGVACGKALQGV